MSFETVDTKNTHASTCELRISPDSPAAYVTTGAVREHFEDIDRVKLLVDRDRSLIALVPGDGPNSYALSPKDNGRSLTVKKELEKLGVDQENLDDVHGCPISEDDESGHLAADVSSVVEAATDDVHCPECGQRFTESGVKQHLKMTHDETYAGRILSEADPDDVGGEVPEGDDSWTDKYEERGEA